MRESEKIKSKWRKARLRLDLGQKEFGELLGVGASYISEIEQGKKEPSHTLAELFKFVCAKQDLVPGAKSSITNPDTKEDDMLKDELIEAYRKNAELYERVLRLEEQLRGKQLPLAGKTVKKKIS
tara:strand:- start:646 stop:1020 length:375 start_codon:yes stop_codon:yes gene_type:complete